MTSYKISFYEGRADGSLPDTDTIIEPAVEAVTAAEALEAATNDRWPIVEEDVDHAMMIDPSTSDSYERFYEAEPV